MELSHLPIIDWDLGVKLAGDKKDLAEEILQLFILNLPTEIHEIQNLYAKKEFLQLMQQVHKMHSALCYCGLPRLKNIIANLETLLKKNIINNLPYLFNQLDTEVTLLLKHYTCINYPSNPANNSLS